MLLLTIVFSITQSQLWNWSSLIIALLITILLGIEIFHNKNIKEFWAFLTPIPLYLIPAFIILFLGGEWLGLGISVIGIMLLIAFIVNSIILGGYLYFRKR